MVKGLNTADERFLHSLLRTTQRIERAQNQIASGKRVTSVSDDPDRVGALLQARADLQSTEQIRGNLGRVKLEVDTAETALASAVKTLDRIRVTGSKGANTSVSPEIRATLAEDIKAALDELVSVANTTVEGRFIFSGDRDDLAAYWTDFSAIPPVSVYSGTPATREVQHPSGTLFRVSKTAQDIFEGPGPGESVFGGVLALREALLANDTAAIESTLADVAISATYLNAQHAFYGSVQARVNGALDFAHRAEVRLKAQIAGVEEADVAQAAIDIAEARFQHEAALMAKGRTSKSTLFDYLG